MAEFNIHFYLHVTPRGARGMLAGLCLCLLATEVSPESVTLNTYYPAPSGVYVNLIATGNTYLARDSGKVGIGTTNPQALLDVKGNIKTGGSIQLGYDGSACAASNAGAMRWNGGAGQIEVCNGAAWGPMAATARGTLGGYCENTANVPIYPATSCAQTCWTHGGTCGIWYVSGCASGWTPFEGGAWNPGSVTYTSFSSCIKN